MEFNGHSGEKDKKPKNKQPKSRVEAKYTYRWYRIPKQRDIVHKDSLGHYPAWLIKEFIVTKTLKKVQRSGDTRPLIRKREIKAIRT